MNDPSDASVEVVRLSAERLDELAPLWSALYEHHQPLTPHLAPRARPLRDTWRDRSALERRWLEEEGGSFVLGAQLRDRLVGYVFVRILTGEVAVSWSVSNPHADLATLSGAARAARPGNWAHTDESGRCGRRCCWNPVVSIDGCEKDAIAARTDGCLSTVGLIGA